MVRPGDLLQIQTHSKTFCLIFPFRTQSNFHMFYYFYDAMDAEERLKDFNLQGGRQYRYLRVPDKFVKSNLDFVRDDPLGNTLKFKDFEQALLALDISQGTLESIYKIFAAILILGDVRFKVCDHDKKAALEDPSIVAKIAPLLKVDEKKFSWALVNHCVLHQGNIEKRRMSAGKKNKINVKFEAVLIPIRTRPISMLNPAS